MFQQDKEDYMYTNYKHKIYESILYDFFKLEKNDYNFWFIREWRTNDYNFWFIRELRTNDYNFILSNANEKIFIEEYNDFYKNKEV